MNLWTQTDDDKPRALWADGHTCSQIAREIGGRTRNSVISRINRIKLPPRKTLVQARHVRVDHDVDLVHAIDAEEAKPKPLPSQRADDIPRIAADDLAPHHCRFIPGDPRAGGKLYCGLTKTPGSSWCPDHHARCHEPATDRRINQRDWHAKKAPMLGAGTTANAKEFTDA
jgi:GcrA cell cycle regulator